MTRSIVTRPDLAGAPLAELKDWLAISSTREDALLAGLLAAALEACEQFTGIVPLAGSYDALLPASRAWQRLPACPVTLIESAAALAASGSERALAAEEYGIRIEADGSGWLRLTSDAAEPRIRVRFAAGMAGSWADVPPSLAQGMIRLAGHHYRERDEGAAQSPPASVAALWRPWRELRL